MGQHDELLGKTIPEIDEQLNSMDEGELREVLDEERAGSNRVGLVNSIERRLARSDGAEAEDADLTDDERLAQEGVVESAAEAASDEAETALPGVDTEIARPEDVDVDETVYPRSYEEAVRAEAEGREVYDPQGELERSREERRQ